MDEKTVPLAKHMMERRQAGKAVPVPWGKKDLDYSALFDQTGECVFIIGLDLRYLAANQQALSLLGYTEEELIGMLVSDVMSLDEELTHVSILGGGANLYERILRRKDGSLLPVRSALPLFITKIMNLLIFKVLRAIFPIEKMQRKFSKNIRASFL